MTAEELIKLALKAIGILGTGQSMRTDQINDGLTILNMMIGQWNRKRWLVPHLVEVARQANGSLYYSVGPGADFDCVRPDRIEDAYIRLNGTASGDFNADFNPDFSGGVDPMAVLSTSVDYPITILTAREDYDRVSLKGMGAFPYYAFYDSAYPIGKIYFWPVPNSTYGLHIIIKDTLNAFPSVTTQINLPPEYAEALYYNLAARLAPTYGAEIKPAIVALATAALNTIRQANTQMPSSKLPALLTRNRRTWSLPTFVGKSGI